MADLGPTPPAENVLPGEKVKTFPAVPGVYIMKDALGRVLYVGKAKNLGGAAHLRPQPHVFVWNELGVEGLVQKWWG